MAKSLKNQKEVYMRLLKKEDYAVCEEERKGYLTKNKRDELISEGGMSERKICCQGRLIIRHSKIFWH